MEGSIIQTQGYVAAKPYESRPGNCCWHLASGGNGCFGYAGSTGKAGGPGCSPQEAAVVEEKNLWLFLLNVGGRGPWMASSTLS